MAPSSLMESGMGAHALWGYTPALDLLSDLGERVPQSQSGRSSAEGGEINILVVQPGDIGHILRTLACKRRHLHTTVNLYVWDRPLEALARHLLLLQVAHDSELPTRHRANAFLEIYGNTKVQERTSRYIARLAEELIEFVCSDDSSSGGGDRGGGGGGLSALVDLSLLKFKERDALEAAFKSWGHSVPYDVDKLRDQRLRHFFKERYDVRRNLVDWDYTGRLKPVAGVVHLKQYRAWRLDGTAVEFGDQVYDHPNRSMASYAEGLMKAGEHRGRVKDVRGFWLDIRSGPFATFGVDCERRDKFAEDLFLVLNRGTGTEQQRHNTAEVAVYNVISYLWEMETGAAYAMSRAHDVYSGLGDEAGAAAAAATVTAPASLATMVPAAATSATAAVASEASAGEASAVGSGLPPAAPAEAAAESAAAARSETAADVAEAAIAASVSKEAAPVESKAAKAAGATAAGADGGGQKGRNGPAWEGGASSGSGSGSRGRAGRSRRQAAGKPRLAFHTVPGVKIFLVGGDLDAVFSKPRFRGLFQRVHVSSNAAQCLGLDAFNAALADGAIITADTTRYVVPLSIPQREQFVAAVRGMAKGHGWQDVAANTTAAAGAAVRGDGNDEAAAGDPDVLAFRFKRGAVK